MLRRGDYLMCCLGDEARSCQQCSHVGKFDLQDVKGLLDVADVPALIVSLPTTSLVSRRARWVKW